MKPINTCDTECYPNYWLAKFRDVDTKQMVKVEMYQGVPLNVGLLQQLLHSATIITFNGLGYDMIMLSAAVTGVSTMTR